MSDLLHTYVLTSLPPGMDKRMFGLELELEQVDSLNKEFFHLAKCDVDHSLRVGGREFISRPVSLQHAIDFWGYVMNGPYVSWMDKSQRCSERCSTHVHVNVLYLSLEEITKIIRLYCILEPGFFEQVDESRKNNIYCVPLSSTKLPEIVHSTNLHYIADKWHKYTAFNAKPLFNLGTLEFRHFQATESHEAFATWLTTIDTFFETAGKLPNLNLDFDGVLALYEQIFPTNLTKSVEEKLLLTYQEDLVNRQVFSNETLMQRIKAFKKGAEQCAA